MEYPKFKYVENSEEVLKYSKKGKKCECCGETSNFYTDFIYAEEDVSCICHECIQSGLACEKYDGSFNEANQIDNVDAYDEVVYKTPVIPTYQEFIWPDCCNDMCKYLRRCTQDDFKNNKIMQDLEQTYQDEYVSLEELKTFPEENILLFQCLHCGKYFVILDLD